MLIGENLHIISPLTKEAIANQDEIFILDNVKKQINMGIKTIDLNVGPAKAKLQGSLKWLIEIIQDNFEVNFSLDTTNLEEMRGGFGVLKNTQNAFLNSTSADYEKLQNTTEIVKKYNANLIALTMNAQSGIAKTADERIEMAFGIVDAASENSIDNSKIWIDPLVLPVCAAQEQTLVALDTLRMIKESFVPEVKTLVGLSNISNGCPKEIRPYINRTFMILALGCGLDGAIVDSFDRELIRLYNIIKENKQEEPIDELYLQLYEATKNFCDIDDIKYQKDDIRQHAIYKCARILLNKEIYSHKFV